MSFDAVLIASDAAGVLFVAVLVLAGVRGIQIGRELIDRVFKNRAYWSSLVVLYIAFFYAQFNLLNFSPGLAPSYLYAFFYSLTWDLLYILLFVFIDSTIMVTTRMDFFHRDALRWASIRRALIPLTIVGILVQGTYYNSPNQANFPGWALAIVVVMDAIWLGSMALAIPALLVGARRTPDRTLRRFVTLLGLVLVSTFAFTFVPLLISDLGYITALVSSQLGNILDPVTAFLLYMMVMSLSPLGRVEKGAGSTSMKSS